MIRNPQDLYTKSFLPSRKLRIILGVIGGIAILIWLVPHVWAWIRTPGTGKTPPEPINPTIATQTNTYLDSDDDGIPDWKEQFIKNYGVIENENGGSSTSDTLSLLDEIPDTQKIALEIAAQIDAGNGSNAQEITEQAITEYVTRLENGFKVYTLYDISLQERDTQQEQHQYAEAMKKISNQINAALESSTIKSIIESYTGDNSESRIRLSTINDIQKNIEEIIKIPIPPSATTVHLNLLNALYRFYQTLSLTAPPANTDPIKSYALVTLVQKNLYTIFSEQTNLAGYFFITLDPTMY